jgi:osmoprotectant transport system permease protein
VPLSFVLAGPRAVLLVPLLALLACACVTRLRGARLLAAVAALAALAALCFLAGDAAARLAATARPAARTTLGAGFWIAILATALAWSEAARRLATGTALRAAIGLLGLVPVAALVAGGALDQLAVMREYATRRGAFADALRGHLFLVGITLAIALPLGIALGALAQRCARWRGPVFTTLNVVQTIPSVALFGLLLSPLAAIGAGGVGTLPAVIALVLYALLPLARTTAEGLDGVAPAAREAARGMGMTRAQVLRHVEAPLALPAVLTGIRITTVQAIGLAVIAALIGAGGLGGILFEGLFANALDLALLGVIPVVLLAVLADATLRLLATLAARR